MDAAGRTVETPPAAAALPPPRRPAWVRAVRLALLLLWAAASFGTSWFARDLQAIVLGWPLNYWLLAQGGVLVFIAIGMLDAWAMNRLAPETPSPAGASGATETGRAPPAGGAAGRP